MFVLLFSRIQACVILVRPRITYSSLYHVNARPVGKVHFVKPMWMDAQTTLVLLVRIKKFSFGSFALKFRLIISASRYVICWWDGGVLFAKLQQYRPELILHVRCRAPTHGRPVFKILFVVQVKLVNDLISHWFWKQRVMCDTLPKRIIISLKTVLTCYEFDFLPIQLLKSYMYVRPYFVTCFQCQLFKLKVWLVQTYQPIRLQVNQQDLSAPHVRLV
jgi:hypothetical protein